jgi:hypothetical protein
VEKSESGEEGLEHSKSPPRYPNRAGGKGRQIGRTTLLEPRNGGEYRYIQSHPSRVTVPADAVGHTQNCARRTLQASNDWIPRSPNKYGDVCNKSKSRYQHLISFHSPPLFLLIAQQHMLILPSFSLATSSRESMLTFRGHHDYSEGRFPVIPSHSLVTSTIPSLPKKLDPLAITTMNNHSFFRCSTSTLTSRTLSLPVTYRQQPYQKDRIGLNWTYKNLISSDLISRW